MNDLPSVYGPLSEELYDYYHVRSAKARVYSFELEVVAHSEEEAQLIVSNMVKESTHYGDNDIEASYLGVNQEGED